MSNKPTTRTFTEEEVEEIADGYPKHLTLVKEEEYGHNRWTQTYKAIVKTEDGKYFPIYYERGLTELQEDYFYEQTVEEVFKSTRVKAEVEVFYNEKKPIEEGYSITFEELDAAMLISDNAENGMHALTTFDTTEVLKLIQDARSTLFDEESTERLYVVEDFFQAVEKLQKSLKKKTKNKQ